MTKTKSHAQIKAEPQCPGSETSDEQLIALIAGQHLQALTELYGRYRYPLGGFLRYRLSQQKLIDEAYNDVMFTVWCNAPIFRGDSRVFTWIFSIAYRVCLTYARTESRDASNIVPMPLDGLADRRTLSQEGPSMVDDLDSVIWELTDNHRLVIELAYFQGCSTAEIVRIVDVPVNTVKIRLYHARQYLKERLQPVIAEKARYETK